MIELISRSNLSLW